MLQTIKQYFSTYEIGTPIRKKRKKKRKKKKKALDRDAPVS